MPMITPDRPIMSLRQTAAILDAVLREVPPERARAATDGPDGWSVVGVVCHLRDYEAVFHERATLMLSADNPALPSPDPDKLARINGYDSANLGAALATFQERRRGFLELLSGLCADQWGRRGVHPRYGDTTVLDLALHAALHDVNHVEQIAHTLAAAGDTARAR